MSRSDDDNDDDLFRRAFRDVRPLRHDKVEPFRPRPTAEPRRTWQNDQETLREMAAAEWLTSEIETGDDLLYHRPGLQNSVLRKLRRGQYAVQDQLDLHGMRSDEAKAAVALFLKEAQNRRYQCVRIVHGKGLGSRDMRPVLKPKLAGWLVKRKDILAFCSARAVDGGTGAIYVLLRRS